MIPKWAAGDVAQIDPSYDPIFGGHFLVVTEVKAWGVQGYCQTLEERDDVNCAAPQAYYRVPFDKITYIGKAEWWTP